MTITAEELRKVYEETFEGAIVAQESQGDAFDAALLAVARYVAEKQRAAETIRVLLETDPHCPNCGHNRDKSSVSSIDNQLGAHSCQMCGIKWREFPSVAPLVVSE